MTRGKNVSLKKIREFIKDLEINKNDKQILLELTPEKYIGLADKIASFYSDL